MTLRLIVFPSARTQGASQKLKWADGTAQLQSLYFLQDQKNDYSCSAFASVSGHYLNGQESGILGHDPSDYVYDLGWDDPANAVSLREEI
jgi:hypothetical protein